MVLIRCKLAFFGDESVGKTCFIKQLLERNFQFEYDMTYGCEFSTHKIQFKQEIEQSKLDQLGINNKSDDDSEQNKFENHIVEFFIMDISGSEMYRNSVPDYSENMNYFILMYDTTNVKSFDNLKSRWLKFCGRVAGKKQNAATIVPGILVGNKTDKKEKQVVTFLSGKQFATQNQLDFFEISSKQYKEVKEVMDRICQNFIARYKDTVENIKFITDNSV